MGSDFVNRKSEFRFINDWINTPVEKNKGIFVYAKSGIGKSRFVTEFFNLELPNHTLKSRWICWELTPLQLAVTLF